MIHEITGNGNNSPINQTTIELPDCGPYLHYTETILFSSSVSLKIQTDISQNNDVFSFFSYMIADMRLVSSQ